jgi:hypothetical protein
MKRKWLNSEVKWRTKQFLNLTWLSGWVAGTGGFFFGRMLRQLLFAPQHLIKYILGDIGRQPPTATMNLNVLAHTTQFIEIDTLPFSNCLGLRILLPVDVDYSKWNLRSALNLCIKQNVLLPIEQEAKEWLEILELRDDAYCTGSVLVLKYSS